MTERQFLWGLSSGIIALAIAGVFWFGLGASSLLKPDSDWRLWSLVTVIQVSTLTSLLWFAFRLRRRSKFSSKDFKHGSELQRNEARLIRSKFIWTTIGQAVLIGLGVYWFVNINYKDLIWPWISFIVSLHFIPLARLFHVRLYYITALAGSMISIVMFTGILKPFSIAYLGVGMAMVMWMSAGYLVSCADKITSKAMRDSWSV